MKKLLTIIFTFFTILEVVTSQCQEPIGYDEDLSELCNDDGFFAHPDDCQLFFQCEDRNATVWTCLCDQLFDLMYNGCNWPEQTYCGERPRPTDLPSGPTMTPTTTRDPINPTDEPPYECPQSEGHFPDFEDCSSFYQCHQWVPYHHTCQASLLYNIPLQVCAFPSDVDCGDRPKP